MKAQVYHYNTASDSRNTFDKILHIQAVFAASNLSKNIIKSMRIIAKAEHTSSNTITAQVNISIAINTTSSHIDCQCWGCGRKDHVFSDDN